MFNLHKNNILPDSDWEELIWLIRFVCKRQATREAWKIFKGNFGIPFQEFLEQQFSIADN